LPLLLYELLRIHLPRTPVNSDTKRRTSVARNGVDDTMPFRTHQRKRSGWVLAEKPNTNGPIRVLLADDHTMFRQGLAGILASYGGMEVVAEAPNDGEALKLARELSPDVVIMQVQLPFERAVATLEALRSFSAPPRW
jgi:PleD family two-component response regulator